jgi:hypothetical protein
MSEFKWSEFQKRMKDADPDFRIIALSDDIPQYPAIPEG